MYQFWGLCQVYGVSRYLCSWALPPVPNFVPGECLLFECLMHNVYCYASPIWLSQLKLFVSIRWRIESFGGPSTKFFFCGKFSIFFSPIIWNVSIKFSRKSNIFLQNFKWKTFVISVRFEFIFWFFFFNSNFS